MTTPFRVLVVCTGNICRSPVAELLLRSGLGAGSGVEVESAGVHACVGEPVAAPMARLARARGLDPDALAGRQLEPGLLRGAGLVLTMTAEQRAAVVRQVPALVRRTFTLLEFADLARLADIGPLPGETAERLAALVQAAPRARARRPVGAADDIADPYGREESAYAEALAAVDEAVAAVLAAISGGVVTHREHRQGLAVTPPAAFG